MRPIQTVHQLVGPELSGSQWQPNYSPYTRHNNLHGCLFEGQGGCLRQLSDQHSSIPCPRQNQCSCWSRVERILGQQRLDARPDNDPPFSEELLHRSVRLTTYPSTDDLHQLEDRPPVSSFGCIQHELERKLLINPTDPQQILLMSPRLHLGVFHISSNAIKQKAFRETLLNEVNGWVYE
jgi:hypothetical protein